MTEIDIGMVIHFQPFHYFSEDYMNIIKKFSHFGWVSQKNDYIMVVYVINFSSKVIYFLITLA